MHNYDGVDLDLLTALADDPRGSFVALSERLGLSRNTVHARMSQLESGGAFLGFDRRINTVPLGYPLTAFVLVTVRQKQLDRISTELAEIPEVLQAHGLSGAADLLVHVVARDAEHLFRVDAAILAIDGVRRTETSLSMGELVPFRVQPLIRRSRQRP